MPTRVLKGRGPSSVRKMRGVHFASGRKEACCWLAVVFTRAQCYVPGMREDGVPARAEDGGRNSGRERRGLWANEKPSHHAIPNALVAGTSRAVREQERTWECVGQTILPGECLTLALPVTTDFVAYATNTAGESGRIFFPLGSNAFWLDPDSEDNKMVARLISCPDKRKGLNQSSLNSGSSTSDITRARPGCTSSRHKC
jgi:hypothetical protein